MRREKCFHLKIEENFMGISRLTNRSNMVKLLSRSCSLVGGGKENYGQECLHQNNNNNHPDDHPK